ncbi:MAG: molybdopterin-dependent oxidoreductase [Thiohalomonas sp.]|nr:molybdopterin-dependent oxidoreductase [Thiohalomonas sp.]
MNWKPSSPVAPITVVHAICWWHIYPMMRVGEGKFKRVSWDEALNFIVKKMNYLKSTYGPTAILDQSYAGAFYALLHKSDQIEGLLGRFLGTFGCRTTSLVCIFL